MNLDPKKHEWLKRADLQTLFAAFPDGALRFVGGCVRNSLMGHAVSDIDIASKQYIDGPHNADCYAFSSL